MRKRTTRPGIADLARAALSWVSRSSLALALMTAFALALSAAALGSADPIDSDALKKLKLEAAADPRNETLSETVRNLDWLARKALFATRESIDAGIALLAIALAAFFASERLRRELFAPVPEPDPLLPAPREDRLKARAFRATAILLAGGVALWAFAASRDGGLALKDIGKALGLVRAPSHAELAAEWPGFRGADAGRARWGAGLEARAGTDAEAVSANEGSAAPLEGVGASPSPRWRVALGLPGFSSPVVWGDAIFISSGDESRQTIARYNAKTGALVWERDVALLVGRKALHGEIGPDTGYAAPTPATDGQRVFAIYPSGFLVALDYSGKFLWFKDFGIPDIPYGYASSPLALGDLLVVQFDTRNLSLLIAFRAEDGSKAWEVERRREPSWASPVAAGEAILVAGNPHVEAYEARSGKLLFEAPFLGAETAPSPAFEGGRAFFATAYARVCAIDIRAQAERFARGEAVESLWEGRELLPDIASPLALNGRLYLAASYGFVSCLDAEYGSTLWRQRVASEFKASPVSDGRIVYLADGEGRIHRIADGGTYRALEPIELGEAIYATPAIVRGSLYVRSVEALFRIDLEGEAGR